MTAFTEHPIMSQAEAVALGFAGFNDVPHKPIDVPDGEYTITARASDGRRVTFCFLPDRERSPAGFVDIQYHDAGTSIPNANGGHSPTFNAFGIGRGGRHILDSRPLDEADRPSILVLMLDKAGNEAKVLSEEIKHHVHEEEMRQEGMFAQACDAGVDLVALRDEMLARMEELKA